MAKLRTIQEIRGLWCKIIKHLTKNAVIIEKTHRTADNARLWMLIIQSQFFFKPLWRTDVITIHARNIFPSCNR